MKTEEVIKIIGDKVIEDGLCEAIILKGSIGRGDDDEFSDIDMYLVVEEKNYDNVMKERKRYLETYGEIIFLSELDFGISQMLAVYKDAVHIDLFVATKDKIGSSDQIKVYYDPNHLFESYAPDIKEYPPTELVEKFNDILFCFVEANTAYQRKNYAWTARIMDQALALSSMLLRYQYDKKHTYLALKKINEILPKEQYALLEQGYANMNKDGFHKTIECIISMLTMFVNDCPSEVKDKLNLKFFNWVKDNINVLLFVRENE